MRYVPLILHLERFLRGEDRSVAWAKAAETLLDDLEPRDALLDELQDGLSLYRPGGGERLIDEKAMERLTRNTLTTLESRGAKRLKVEHFGGAVEVDDSAALDRVLDARYGNDVNEYWLGGEEKYPCLAIQVRGSVACLHFFPRDGHPGFLSVGDETAAGIETFYTNTPTEGVTSPPAQLFHLTKHERRLTSTSALARCRARFGGSSYSPRVTQRGVLTRTRSLRSRTFSCEAIE